VNHNAVQYNAHFDSKIATDQSVQAAVAQILKLAGCSNCGRIGHVAIQFIGDPGPDLLKMGVTSLSQRAFG
jgi:hypothetical protein